MPCSLTPCVISHEPEDSLPPSLFQLTESPSGILPTFFRLFRLVSSPLYCCLRLEADGTQLMSPARILTSSSFPTFKPLLYPNLPPVIPLSHQPDDSAPVPLLLWMFRAIQSDQHRTAHQPLCTIRSDRHGPSRKLPMLHASSMFLALMFYHPRLLHTGPPWPFCSVLRAVIPFSDCDAY
jgi:hypothetical protein